MSINLAKTIAKAFIANGKPIGVRPAVLTKVTPGTRMPGAISAGTNPTTIDYSATGLVSDYSAYELQNTLIQSGDRKVLLFGASIADGAVPAPGDQVTIGGETLAIVGPVQRDPAAATYQLQCRP